MQYQTTYESCRYHAEGLQNNAGSLIQRLILFAETDHHESALASPMLLEIDEELIELNIRLERLIQRIDPSFSGEYTEGEQ
jgi:hypothetical protein